MKRSLRPLALLPVAGLLALGGTACTSPHPSAAASGPGSASSAVASGSGTQSGEDTAAPSSSGRSPSVATAGASAAATTAEGAEPTGASAGWQRTTVAGLPLELPTSWHVIRHGADEACLEPLRSAGLPTLFGCAGVEVKWGEIRGSEMRPYAADQAGGWYPALDVQPCPVKASLPGGQFNGVRFGAGSEPVESGLRTVGDRKASYDRWQAYCDSGYTFSPQGWYLPVSKVLFLDYTGHSETAHILSSVGFPG